MTFSDIDECAVGTDDCDTNADCTHTAGGFSCACHTGHEGDGETCSDIDECAVGADDCDTSADCSKIAGGFSCACHTGYEEPSVQSSLMATTISQDEKFKNSPLVSAHPRWALIKWLLVESLRSGGVVAQSSSLEVRLTVAPTL